MIGVNSLRATGAVWLPWAGLVFMLFFASPASMANEQQPAKSLRDMDSALGINAEFGRWDNQINLVYDPDGAPPLFANANDVLDLLEAATAEWELVSGIRFNVTGTDSNAVNDDNLGPGSKDGLVRVFWGNAGGAAGLAGPDFGFFDADLGYFPYFDGSLELNQDPEQWDIQSDLVGILVHELGHLMGFGHSDNPDSVMFANPYNNLNHPRADDILAARALYGNGSLTIANVTEPLEQWLYDPLPVAPPSDLEFLFKPNQTTDKGAFISVGSNTPVTEITNSAPGNVFVFFNFGGIGDFSNNTDIDIDATIHFVDPFGYLYAQRPWQIECASGFACGGGGASVATTDVIKTIPGQWTVYVIDNSKQTTLLELPFMVNTSPEFNQPPVAGIIVNGLSGTSVNITLNVSDPEGDSIEVIWHPQGNSGDQDNDGFQDTGITDFAESGEIVSRDFTFLSAETHTLFVELKDDKPRYDGSIPGSSSAGDGFQNLIAITLDLPVSSDNDVAIRTSYETENPNTVNTDDGDNGNSTNTNQALVDAIAESSPLDQITTTDGAGTTARFGAGASSDSGSTTATSFSNGDEIVIAGSVSPQLDDIGHAGEIYVVLYTNSFLATLDVDGNYVNWSGSLKNIQPAFVRTNLLLNENFELFSGAVQSGLYRVFIGYRLTDGGPIHFNARAFRITVD